MARLYAVLHCFENEIRSLIRETLEEHEGPDWADKLPAKVKQFAEDRKKSALADTWLEGEKSDFLGFMEFGHLSQIIIDKWQFFEDIIPSQHWLKQRMDELEKARQGQAGGREDFGEAFAEVAVREINTAHAARSYSTACS